jgi:hypothetical protein
LILSAERVLTEHYAWDSAEYASAAKYCGGDRLAADLHGVAVEISQHVATKRRRSATC